MLDFLCNRIDKIGQKNLNYLKVVQEIRAVEFSTFKLALTTIMIKIITRYDSAPYLVLINSILSPSFLLVFRSLKEITLNMFGITA
tara:strand:- start:4 stop:261 length:258 start_codon:yes stop_codon:yes gene_type:complete